MHLIPKESAKLFRTCSLITLSFQQALCDKDRSSKKVKSLLVFVVRILDTFEGKNGMLKYPDLFFHLLLKVPGPGTLERRLLEVNRKRVKVVKPGSKTSFPTTEIRGTYAPPFHVCDFS